MIAESYKIIKHRKKNMIEVANVSDFLYEDPKSVNANSLLHNPNITLYCIDPFRKLAIFIETPENIKLNDAAFYYIAQYKNAINAYTLSFRQLHKFAKKVKLANDQLIFIFSVGRCGSTFLSSAFNTIPNIESLSEPDVFSQLSILKNRNILSEKEINRLIISCTKVICKNPRQGGQLKFAIKFRSFAIDIAEVLITNFKEAKNIFMYRDGQTWLRSAVRAFSNPSADNIDLVARSISMSWLAVMEKYMRLYQDGISMFAVQYKDIIGNTETVIKDIFSHCEISNVNWDILSSLVNSDSQEGTVLSRTSVNQKTINIPERCFLEFKELLKSRPTVNSVDYILPNTHSY